MLKYRNQLCWSTETKETIHCPAKEKDSSICQEALCSGLPLILQRAENNNQKMNRRRLLPVRHDNARHQEGTQSDHLLKFLMLSMPYQSFRTFITGVPATTCKSVDKCNRKTLWLLPFVHIHKSARTALTGRHPLKNKCTAKGCLFWSRKSIFSSRWHLHWRGALIIIIRKKAWTRKI